MRGVTEAKKDEGQCKGYVAPDVPVSACGIIQIFKWETYFHCSSMRDEREFISLISPCLLLPICLVSCQEELTLPPGPSGYSKSYIWTPRNGPGNQGLYQCQSLGSRVKKKESEESMSEKMGLQEKTPLWEDNNFITR